MHEPLTEAEIHSARARIGGHCIRTPVIRLPVDVDGAEIFLKLENLQPIGSFKIRGAANLMMQVDRDQLRDGVWTASAGNMAQGVAWCAREMGVPCSVVVPDTAPEAKLAAIKRLGASIVPVSVEEFFDTFGTRKKGGMRGLFVHAFSDRRVMAGNATIGAEILEDLPGVDSILLPYGGGGLVSGIASAVKFASSSTRIIACEPETVAPFAASFKAGARVEPVTKRTFVDGAGGPRVYPEMFELARNLVDGACAVRIPEVASAIRMLAERAHVVAEGAGALPLAAALAGAAGKGRICCVISGGNINPGTLATILGGGVPD